MIVLNYPNHFFPHGELCAGAQVTAPLTRHIGKGTGGAAVGSKAVDKRHRGANGQPMNYKPREKKSKVEQTFTNQTVDVSGEGAPVLLPSIKGEPSPT